MGYISLPRCQRLEMVDSMWRLLRSYSSMNDSDKFRMNVQSIAEFHFGGSTSLALSGQRRLIIKNVIAASNSGRGIPEASK